MAVYRAFEPVDKCQQALRKCFAATFGDLERASFVAIRGAMGEGFVAGYQQLLLRFADGMNVTGAEQLHETLFWTGVGAVTGSVVDVVLDSVWLAFPETRGTVHAAYTSVVYGGVAVIPGTLLGLPLGPLFSVERPGHAARVGAAVLSATGAVVSAVHGFREGKQEIRERPEFLYWDETKRQMESGTS